MKIKYLFGSIITYFQQKKLSKQFESLSKSQIELIQFENLKRLICYAWEKVPFYRENWGKAGFQPSHFESIEDIHRIPIIDRNDIIRNLDEFVPIDYNKSKLSLVTTGGTSGMPMKFYIDNYIARAKEVAFLDTVYKSYARSSWTDKVAIFRGLRINEGLINKKCFWKWSWTKMGLVFSSFHLTQENFPFYLKKLRKYKPSIIMAYPSAIVELCNLIKVNNEAPLKSLKKVICSSENIYQWQRDLVRKVLGVEIFSLYGHSEKCVLGIQIEQNRMLFHPLYGFTEFLLTDAQKAKSGDRAEVVVTGFEHSYFPLIRYRTNDFVNVHISDSYAQMIANQIIGREQDFVIDRYNNKIQFTNQDEPFWNVDGVIAYQYIQMKEGELILNIQTCDSYDKGNDELLLSEINKIFINFTVKINHVENIEKTPRGKFKYLVQNLKLNQQWKKSEEIF